MVILVVGVVGLAIFWRSRYDTAWLLSACLIAPAGLLYLLSGQPRLLPPVLVGAGIASGLVARRLAGMNESWRRIAPILLVAPALLLLIPADRAVADFARFYQVADESLLNAASAIAEDDEPGVVAVRQESRGWPLGWWFEALLQNPIIVGSDRRWLGFPDEWERARQAEEIFDGSLDAEQFREVAANAGVRYLVTRKWDWIGWERWTTTPDFPVSVLYDDDEFLVLRVR
jgi:hypothetical protein